MKWKGRQGFPSALVPRIDSVPRTSRNIQHTHDTSSNSRGKIILHETCPARSQRVLLNSALTARDNFFCLRIENLNLPPANCFMSARPNLEKTSRTRASRSATDNLLPFLRELLISTSARVIATSTRDWCETAGSLRTRRRHYLARCPLSYLTLLPHLFDARRTP